MVAEQCAEAFRLEWQLMPQIEIVPGMSQAAIKNFYIAHKQKLQDCRFARCMIALWEAVNDFLKNVRKDGARSGRIVIKENRPQARGRGARGLAGAQAVAGASDDHGRHAARTADAAGVLPASRSRRTDRS